MAHKKIVGIASFAALLGAYFLYGTKKGKQKRKDISGWMIKMKGEVVERLEGLKDVNEETYGKVVDDVSRHFQKIKKVSATELASLVAELKADWKALKRGEKKHARQKKSI